MMHRGSDKRAALVMGLALAACLLGCMPPEQTRGGSSAGSTSLVRDTTAGGPPSGAGTQVPQGMEVQALTPSEQRMRRQSRNFQKTVWQGALIGAAGGALWGVLRGDDVKGVLQKALIGGAVGGLAGAYVAHKQREYSDKEDQLDSMIADVRNSNRDAEALIASAREVLAEDRRRLAAAERRYREGKAGYEELERERGRIAANRNVVEEAAGGAREQYGMFDGAKREFQRQNPETSTAQLERELETYNEQIETLDDLAEGMTLA